ncbi:TraR/DksA family transcriptional regulator [Micromonospora siamensis]|uniref:RNA polymerase-binding transcription factor DksA n=1 Tax=Micromonospora siamensis TaxID=299152 RepID=A0A1C5IHS0_9ACTN|nr:TraR/DksA C4-type zinc finger protein [Micromonospora siamensis]SCG57296.1 RNA polymerase-binding transcription factor DksA [Micromonospora siamensis]
MSTDLHRSDPQWLTQARATLTGEFAAQTARLTELTADTGDPAEAHTRSALIAATRQSLAQITDALGRMADGSYGSCQRCAGRIPPERLEILPHATFCVPCQQRQNG